MDKVKMKSLKWLKSKKILAVLFVFSMLVLGSSISWFIIQNNWLEKDYDQQQLLSLQEDKFDDLYRLIQKAESGIRGYAVTEKKSYIANADLLLDSIQIEYQGLKNYLQKEPGRSGNYLFAEFDSLINEKISFMRQAKKLCDANDCEGALKLIATEKGIVLTASILKNTEELNSAIRNSLIESREKFAKINKRNNYIAYIGSFLALLLLWIFIFLLRKENQRTRKISEELRIHKEHFNVALNSISEGLITTGNSGKIKFMNSSAERLTGWKNEEAMDKPLQQVYNVVNEETGLPFENVADRIIKDRKVIELENNTILKTKNSKEIIISNSGSPLMGTNGEIAGAVLVFNDITGKKFYEQELEKSNKIFNNLIQHLPEAVYTCDENGYIQVYNKAAEDLWGRKPIAGKDRWNGAYKLLHTDGTILQHENAPVAVTIKQQKPVNGKELKIEREDGTIRHVLSSPAPIFDISGQLTGAVNMLIDITDKKEREILIKQTEEKYRSFIEQASDTIVTYSLDGTIHEFNNIILDISGYTREEFEKLNLKDIIVGDLIADPEKVNDILAGKATTISRQFKRKNGSIVEIESKLKLLPDGKILAFGRDITERKKAEAELRQMKESYLTLMNSIDGIVWEADAKTFEFSFVSEQARRLLGYPPEQWISQATFWADHIYQEDRNWAIDYCITCTREKRSHDFEYRMVAADGRIVWLRDMVSVQVENGEPSKLIGIMVDITNQKQTENEIREKNEQLRILSEHLQKIREEERTNMAREIHDELGQQLTIMKMDIAWLQESISKENNAIQKRTTELMNMLDQTVTTVRRIAHELRPSMLDDMGLVAAIEWQLEEFERRAGVKTKYEGSCSRLPLSDAAKTGLFRIVQESLTNVARYAKAENVKVSLQEQDNDIILKIVDDGIGFEPEKLAFKKTLGIVGMKERSLMLGGEFKIDSTYGSGTKIKVTVPAYRDMN